VGLRQSLAAAEHESRETDDVPPNPQRRNPQSYAAILDATLDQLTSVGYHRMTIEAISAQARVGKATVYRWWPSKARLVVEALSKRCELPPVTATGDLRHDVHCLVERAIEIMVKSPLGHALPHLAIDFDDDPEARAELLKWLGPTRASQLAMLYEAAGRGDLPHDLDAGLALDLIAGTLMYRNLLGQHSDDHIVDQLTSLIVDRRLPRAGAEDNRLI
jgi:AcrR family transcriptional regulator